MDSSPTQTPREKLEAWLRYYDDLNLGAFYTDRRTMGKRPIKRAAEETPAVLPVMRPAIAIAPAKAAPPVSVLPIVNAPSLFEAIDRVENDTLERIREDLGECTRCRLHLQRNKIVFGAGNPRAELVFVGEGPGHDEDVQGLPFVGRAGKLLTQMIEAMGLTREQVYICNVVKCRPPENRKPEDDEVATCSPYLYRQLDVIAPKGRLLLAIDDTPSKRYGPKVEGAGVHHNPTPGPAGAKFVYGHVWVTLAWVVRHPLWGAIGLPLWARL